MAELNLDHRARLSAMALPITEAVGPRLALVIRALALGDPDLVVAAGRDVHLTGVARAPFVCMGWGPPL